MGALLAAAALFFGLSALGPKKTKKKKKPPPGITEGILVTEWTPAGVDDDGPAPAPVPGALCPATVLNEGEHAVFGNEGECIVFWTDGVTDEQLRQALVDVWDEVGQPDVCAADTYSEVGDEWIPNPYREALLVETLADFYDQPSEAFPPEPDSPVWIDEVWAMAQQVLREEFCGGHAYG